MFLFFQISLMSFPFVEYIDAESTSCVLMISFKGSSNKNSFSAKTPNLELFARIVANSLPSLMYFCFKELICWFMRKKVPKMVNNVKILKIVKKKSKTKL